MTDYTGIALVIGAIFAGLTSLGTLVKLYMTELAKAKQDALDRAKAEAKEKQDRIDKDEAKEALKVAADKVEEVKATLNDKTVASDEKLDRVVTTTNDMLGKVNGTVTLHLTTVADMADELVAEDPDNQGYKSRAQIARKALDDHVTQLAASEARHN